jgi:hypothetical protein
MSKQTFSKEFAVCVRDYLPTGARIREIDGEGKPGADARPERLSNHRFYCLDADAVTACGHAIEDLAIEEGSGALLAAFQDFRYFHAARERYEQLAISIDRVEVLATGKVPRPIRRVKFLRDTASTCKEFWMIAYEGTRHSALLVCRQMNAARHFDEKEFIGFFTFSPRLTARLRANMLALLAGRARALTEFTRLMAIDQFAKQLDIEFTRQKDEMIQAVRRLQSDAADYRPGHFASDLEKGLTRLQQWKNRLPAMLERVQGI